MYPTKEAHFQQILEDVPNYEDKNYNVIQKAFINVIFAERVHQVAYKRSRRDSDYLAAEQDAGLALAQLEKTLITDEQKKLLGELEDAWSNMYGIFLEYSYSQGLADSPMIHKELEKYGISVVKEATERQVKGNSTVFIVFPIEDSFLHRIKGEARR